ncbi:MAG: CoA-binding protein [Elusimicrobia bacterium HGW-Elusimicrobia-1]|jgi:predicted CoA-binding protein|nr:MAG: CoA-binding protein [Elusimicrobia bacterium HGW-Elusimicrobia-1]
MDIPQILKTARVIAVVGLSPKADRPSNVVAAYLKKAGYKIIPVNPGQTEILGEKCYKSLLDVPEKIDIADVFRRPEEVPAVAADAVKIGARVLWLQEGVVSQEASTLARAAGLEVVMDRCILKEHSGIFGG